MKKSFVWLLVSLAGAAAGFVLSSGVHSLAEFRDLQLVAALILALGSVFRAWFAQAPLDATLDDRMIESYRRHTKGRK